MQSLNERSIDNRGLKMKKLIQHSTASLVLACGLTLQAAAQTSGPPPTPPPAPKAECTRATLQTAVDSYIAAQKSGDRTKMAFADKVTYLENMSPVEADKGLWNSKLPISLSRSSLDKDRCRTFSEVIVTEGDHPYVIGTRLYVDKGKITRIDSLVTDKGDWLFNANAYLKYSKAEDWRVLKPSERVSNQQMIDGANAYLDFFSDKFVEQPWGVPCARLEGGAYTNRSNKPDASCQVGIPNGVLYIVNRDYVVDEELGVVNIFCRFGDSKNGMPDSHTFKYENGKYRYVHTLSVSIGRDSPQATDEGDMVRAPAQ
jgi:hypothetical protein